ncbi:Ribosomal RNA small subunit methyltransferase D [Gammaproteobacteria bacterium]
MACRGRNQLRIIAGRWRGSILPFPDAQGLRPTPDRVRETLFNWLQGVVIGARCLDLFSGSGALGLEALSRGAAEAILVEYNPLVAMALRGHLERLRVEHGQVVQANVLDYLCGISRPFDLVFLDPPFYQDWLSRCCPLLKEHGWLAPNAKIYLETEAELSPLPLPTNWELIRTRRTGQVGYHLARQEPHA